MTPDTDVAGLTLLPPRLLYNAEGSPWGSASLARPHLGSSLEAATLTLRASEDGPAATFEVRPFLQPAVQPYLPTPAGEWRALIVEHRLLGRPELVWTGTLPSVPATPVWGTPRDPQAQALADALSALHRRWLSLTQPHMADYTLRSLECAECRADRASKLPAGLPPWQVQIRMSTPMRCTHGGDALLAAGALCRAHPELTFELLGWIEPAGARTTAEGPPVTRFALTGPVMEAVLGPWLVGEERKLAPRTTYRGYASFAHYDPRLSREAPDPRRPTLPRAERAAVALAAEAWGLTASPEALVYGEQGAREPGLDRAAAPAFETPAALPGEPLRGKARARRGARGR